MVSSETAYRRHTSGIRSPILRANRESLTDGELDSLWRIWQRQKQELSGQGTLQEFDKRLAREWAIETGIIEDVYTLDHSRSTTKRMSNPRKRGSLSGRTAWSFAA